MTSNADSSSRPNRGEHRRRFTPAEIAAREAEIVAIARRTIGGEMWLIQGTRELLVAAYEIDVDYYPIFRIILQFFDRTTHIPLSEQHAPRHSLADLQRLRRQGRRLEAMWRTRVVAACAEIIDEFSDPSPWHPTIEEMELELERRGRRPSPGQ